MIKKKEKGKPGLDFLIMLQNRKSRETWHVLFCITRLLTDVHCKTESINECVRISNSKGPDVGLAVGSFLSCCRFNSVENHIKIHEL